MMRFVPATLLAPALLVAAPAQAGDSRLVTRLYDADQVVRIEGRAGVQASIAFGEDELIENVAIGDANAWQVTPNKRANMLFVKPLGQSGRTNLTVVTDRHTYYFDLVANAAARPLYVLRFTYPEPPPGSEPKPALPANAALSAEEAGTIDGSARPVDAKPVDPADLNFAWRARGKGSLVPARVYDDGQATYLAWAAGVPIPAIQIRDAGGNEGPVNFAVREDVIVIDGVPPLIVLRSGRDHATLTNEGKPRRGGDVPEVAAAPAPAPATASAAPALPSLPPQLGAQQAPQQQGPQQQGMQ